MKKSILVSSLSDIEAIESTPLIQQGLAENTYEIFQRSAKQHGDKIAIRFLLTGNPDEQSFNYSYNDLLKRITQAANTFYHLGLTEKDVVSLLLPNLPQTHFAFWGAEAAGISNAINPLLEPEQIVDIMNAVKTKVLVTLAPFPNTDLWEKAKVIAERVPSLKAILTVNLTQFINPAAKSTTFQHSEKTHLLIEDFDYLLSQHHDNILDNQRTIKASDVACYFHTGGTTGSPKIAIHNHGNHVFQGWMIGKMLNWKSNEVVQCGLPLFHVSAPFITGLAPFTVGAEVVMTSPQGFRSEVVISNFWKLVERYKVSFFVAVPTIYRALNEIPIQGHNLSSLKFAICGAAPMPTSLIKEFEQRTGLTILEGYGLTEGMGVSAVNPPFGDRRSGSVGIRIFYQQMKTVQLDENGKFTRDCKPNEIGAVVIKGPNVFPGYLQKENNNNVWNDTWFITGDLARQDEDGYIWITGRSKDIIIRSGHNIDPQMIEEPLNHHPAIAMVAAVGKPDLKAGELPVAYVTLRTGQKITEDELMTYAAEKITERAAIPKNIFIIEKMPLTAVGKIFKPTLRYDAIKRVFEEALTPLKNQGIHYEILVKAHPLQGQIATIKLINKDYSSELENQILELLGYPIAVEIKKMDY